MNNNNTIWVLDPSHSELSFKARHLMISTVRGEFRKFSAVIGGEDFTSAPVKVTIDAASVFTNDDNRDAHLRSADFFDADQHKEIVFQSDSFTKGDDGLYTLTGDLTIRGTTKKVKLKVEFGGVNKDPWGNEKAAFSVEGTVNRKEWGLNWNAALETGGVLVADEVRIVADVQFVKKTVE